MVEFLRFPHKYIYSCFLSNERYNEGAGRICVQKTKIIITGGNIMFNQVDFGKRVKEFRARNNYSQKKIAFRIGVSEQAVSKWENGASQSETLLKDWN